MAITQVPIRQNFSENVDYIIPQYPVYIRKGLLSSYPGYRAISHWHEDVEFIYILSGEMDYEVNGTVISLHKSEGIIVNSRNFHYGFSNEHRECEFICILIHPDLFASNAYIQENYVLPFTECAGLPYIFLGDMTWHKHLTGFLYEMLSLNTRDDNFCLKCQDIVTSVFYLLYKNTKESLRAEQKSSGQALSALRQMVRHIQNHYAEPLTLSEIAQAGNMGKTSCCAVFNAYMHTSPIDYLLTYRMSQSLRLLSQSDLSVTEIAYRVGFHDSSYITKYFRKYFGKTPREIRKRPQT